MERKFGIIASCISSQTEKENLQLIKDHGFTSFFSSEKEFGEKYVAELKNQAVKLGLEYEFMHGPFAGINEMWTSKETPKIFYDFKQAIDSASQSGVKTVVAHVSSSFNPPQINPLGLSRFDDWVEHAEKKGVTLAFENLRRLGNFAYLMDRYEKNESVKYCYDCGHEHCYTIRVPFLTLYGERLACTHLHDNFGRDDKLSNGGDLHLLPFDGNIDYSRVMNGLKKANYKGNLTLEIFSEFYPNLSADEFLKSAYERAQKLVTLLES